MKITEGYNVSFCWCFPKVDNNTCEAYCYAYVREFESGNCIYAGVKYEGSKFDLKKYKCHLRKTAIERLLKKPIFCITPIGENLKNLLDHKNKRLNGIDMQSLEQGKKAKYSTVLAKFFTYSSFHYKLGLCANKKNPNIVFDRNLNLLRNVFTDKIQLDFTKGNHIYLDIGCYYNNGFFKINPRDNDSIVKSGIGIIINKFKNLYSLSYFSGKDKLRVNLTDYQTQTDHYLSQFGIKREPVIEKQKGIYMTEVEYDTRVRYSKIRLSNNTTLHLTLMKFVKWKRMIDDYCNLHHNFMIDSDDYNEVIVLSYHYQVHTKDKYENEFQSLKGRKIVFNKLIFRPIFININRAFVRNVMEVQDLVVKNITKMPKEGKYLYLGDEDQVLDLHQYLYGYFMILRNFIPSKFNPNEIPITDFYNFMKRKVLNLFKRKTIF